MAKCENNSLNKGEDRPDGKKEVRSAQEADARFYSERRRCSRVQLDRPCFATLHVEAGESYKVMLTDIGSQGAQVLLPPQLEPAGIPDGARLFLYGFPDELSMFKDKEFQGTLAWRGVRNCGISFNEPLDLPLDETLIFGANSLSHD